jgi:lysophospholipase L1-like esterase
MKKRRILAFVAVNVVTLVAVYAAWVRYSYLIVPIEKPYEIRIKYRQYDGYYKAEPGRYDNPKYRSVFTINQLGFRGREFETAKDGQYRIVTMGESSTMGLESNDGYTWPERLQEYLSGDRTAIEVVNCGMAGHASPHSLAMLRAEILGCRPDLIVYYAGHNDHHVGNIERHPGPSWPADKMSFFRHWFIFKRIQARLIALQLLGFDVDDWIPWSNRTWSEHYRANLAAMVRESHAGSIPWVMVTQMQDYSPGILASILRGDEKVAFARVLSLRHLSSTCASSTSCTFSARSRPSTTTFASSACTARSRRLSARGSRSSSTTSIRRRRGTT